jgi:hypothetical protein
MTTTTLSSPHDYRAANSVLGAAYGRLAAALQILQYGDIDDAAFDEHEAAVEAVEAASRVLATLPVPAVEPTRRLFPA